MKNASSPVKQGTLVVKFGGTSVGTVKAMRQVVTIVKNERSRWKNLVVVTSALDGVTDTLLSMTTQTSLSQEGFLVKAALELKRRTHRHARSVYALCHPHLVSALRHPQRALQTGECVRP